MGGLRLISRAATWPITKAEVKSQTRVDDDDEDDVIDGVLIPAATTYVEDYLQRALIDQTWELALDRFCGEIEIPRPPLIEIVSVKYDDGNLAEQIVDSANYSVDLY